LVCPEETNGAAAGHLRRRGDREEVNKITMRKILALAMVALLALTVAFAALGCGAKKTETTTTSETSTGGMDSSMHMDSAGADTMHH
jgi:hypothetical protein